MDSVVASAMSAGGRTDLTRQLLEPMRRQLELVQEVIEREQRLQKELMSRLLGPVDAVFDLLEESGAMLRSQAEAIETAGRALEQSAGLMKAQAEMFERTVGMMRAPTKLAKEAAGLQRPARKGARRQPARATPKKKR